MHEMGWYLGVYTLLRLGTGLEKHLASACVHVVINYAPTYISCALVVALHDVQFVHAPNRGARMLHLTLCAWSL
jgi:hypothetical protein